jgi:putative ABC transport system permease protein
MLGVIIGVASLVALTSVASGATSGITDSLNSLGANKITVSSQNPSALKESEALAIAGFDDVKQVGIQTSATTQLVFGNEQTQVSLAGVSSNYLELNSPEMLFGSFLTNVESLQEANQITLNSVAADALGIGAEHIGQSVTLFGQPYVLTGVVDSSSGFNSQGSAYVSLENSRTLFAQYPYLSTIEVEAISSEAVSNVEAEVTEFLLESYQVTEEEAQFTIRNQASVQDTIGSITGTLSLLLGGISSISLVVGGIGIMNIMLVSVRERTKEIGIRRAIGATRRQILTQFMIEAVVLSVMGGILGLIVGEGVALLIAQIAGWSFAIDAGTVGLSIAFSVLVGVVFGVWPARGAARLQVVEALRYE